MAPLSWKECLNRTLRWNPSSCYESLVTEEHDDHERPADLWLYCSPVGGSAGSCHRPSSQSQKNNTGEAGPINTQTSHWILVFKYQDGTICAIDGNESNNKLTPYYRKSIEESWTEVKYIYTLGISPKEVREIAVSHPLNGQDYSVLGSNCHIWVNRVLKYLGLNERSDTIDDLIKGVAVVTVAGVAVAGLSMAICNLATGKEEKKLKTK